MSVDDPIDAARLRQVILSVVNRMIALRDVLNQLDAALGDGDTGLTVAKGAAGVQAYLATQPASVDQGALLTDVGLAFNRAAPSTMGALLATALVRAGKEARGKAILDNATLAAMLQAADRGVQERGKTQPGDKTIVDALHPAAEAFADAITRGEPRHLAALAALAAARGGREAATALRSRVGRAGWIGERTVGHPDPGATLFVAMLEAALDNDPSAASGASH